MHTVTVEVFRRLLLAQHVPSVSMRAAPGQDRTGTRQDRPDTCTGWIDMRYMHPEYVRGMQQLTVGHATTRPMYR